MKLIIKPNLKKIIELRLKSCKTVLQLSYDLRICQSAIAMLESGKRKASVNLAYKICKYYNVPFDELFTVEEGE